MNHMYVVYVGLVAASACLSCSVEVVEPPERLGCGPRVESQVDSVRALVLSNLASDVLEHAADRGSKLYAMALATQELLEPGGLISFFDPPDAVTRVVAKQDPRIVPYSRVAPAPFQQLENPRRWVLLLATGDICWQGPARATVQASIILSSDDDRSYEFQVANRNGTWQVMSRE